MVPVEAASLRASMDKRLRNFDYVCERSERRSIFRVPPYIRDQNKSDYDPKLISIGPYHHGAEAVQAMEPLKRSYLQDLIFRSLDGYISIISKKEKDIRACYAEEIELERDALVMMMVLDGCFIVELLIKSFLKEDDDRMGARRWNPRLLKNDLLLLENQIPIFVLQELFDISTIPNPKMKRGDTTLLELAASYLAPRKLKSLVKPRPPPVLTLLEQVPFPHHLLQLYHASLAGPDDASGSRLSYCCGVPRMAKRMASALFFCLLSLFLCYRSSQSTLPDEENPINAPTAIWSATALIEAGVKFKRKKDAGSFLDVTFTGGTMEIPKLLVLRTTASSFRNLLAYEQCYPQAAGSCFTSYAALMNDLIGTRDDVAVLKACGIIESKLGRDDDVADLFNQLHKSGHILDYEERYTKLLRDVNEYCTLNRHSWRANLKMNENFRSPWAIVSVTAAVILLVLTVVHTFFAMFLIITRAIYPDLLLQST